MQTQTQSHQLNKYERTKAIGMRLMQIANGAEPLVVVEPGMSVRDIVMKEEAEGKIPFIIERTLPNNEKVYLKLSK